MGFIDVIVSIHAPVKGATIKRRRQHGKAMVSIHAPVKGATRWNLLCWTSRRRFNPRPREGGDFYDVVLRVERNEFQSTPP